MFFCVIGYWIQYVDVTGDAVLYANRFMMVQKLPFTELYKLRAEGMTDVFALYSMYFVGLFFSTPKALFVFWGALYGWIVSLSIYYIISKVGKSQRYLLFILILFLMNPHSNINGMRFWFATWVYFYSVLHLLNKENIKWWIIMLSTVFIHNTFLIPIVFFMCLKYLNLSRRLLINLLVVSFILGHVFPITDYLRNIPFLSSNDHYSMYVDADYIKEWQISKGKRSSANQFLTSLPYYFIFVMLMIWGGGEMRGISFQKKASERFIFNTYSLCILFFSAHCFFKQLPSLGRFAIIMYMLLMILTMLMMKSGYIKNSKTIRAVYCIVFSGLIYLALINMGNVLDSSYLLPTFLM